jgi:hypothetical protein
LKAGIRIHQRGDPSAARIEFSTGVPSTMNCSAMISAREKAR